MTRAPASHLDPRFGSEAGPGFRPARFPPGAISCSYAGQDTISIVDAETLRVRRRIPVGSWSAAVSPDGRSAALGQEDGSVSILDLRTGEQRPLSGRHEDRVHE